MPSGPHRKPVPHQSDHSWLVLADSGFQRYGGLLPLLFWILYYLSRHTFILVLTKFVASESFLPFLPNLSDHTSLHSFLYVHPNLSETEIWDLSLQTFLQGIRELFCFSPSCALEFYTNLVRCRSLSKGCHSVHALGLSKGSLYSTDSQAQYLRFPIKTQFPCLQVSY